MIIINKSGYLKHKNLRFRCALGKSGVKKKIKEGDNVTPKGTYKIVDIYYRKDRVKNISSKFKLIKITKKMGWCDDPSSENYNQLIKLPTKCGHEKLYRKDNIYDLIIIINYNMNPTVKNKGSAIFIHIKNGNFKKTRGCVAIKKADLLKITSAIQKNTKIIIG